MTTKKSLNALDRSFLASERRDVMMHVGALLQFSPSKGSSPNLMRDLREELTREVKVERPWNLRLLHPEILTNPVQAWVPDEAFNIVVSNVPGPENPLYFRGWR